MVTTVAEPVVADPCVHNWIIAPPNGPLSVGHCTRCHAEREFPNSIVDDKRVNNTDIFTGRRSASRHSLREEDVDSAVRSMYRH